MTLKSSRRGFAQRAASGLLAVAAAGLLLSLSGVSAERMTAADNAVSYARWQQAPPDSALPDRIGSFTVRRPAHELLLGGLAEQWQSLLARETRADAYSDYARRALRDKLVFNRETDDFRGWLLARRDAATERLTRDTVDYLTNYLVERAESQAASAGAVRNIDWDFTSPLGERKWQTGLSALGSLRETEDDVVAWQLRGYAAQDSTAGANAGVIYRRAVNETLLGANVFLDYEQHGGYDESFWRWSLGGEWRSELVNIYANRYWAITDAIADDGEYIYSRSGYDIEIAARIVRSLDISGGLTFYKWEGEFGDEDETGLIYNVRFNPLLHRLPGLEIETQLNHPDEGKVDWGGKIAYSHVLGAPERSRSVKSLSFDPRAHFFDPVRREYSQRIARSGGGADNRVLVTVVAGAATLYAVSGGQTEIITLTAAGDDIALIRAPTVTIDAIGGGVTVLLTSFAWHADVHERTSLVIQDYGRQLHVITGTIQVMRRTGNRPDTLSSGGVTVLLLGTTLEIGRVGARDEVRVSLESGRIAVTLNSYDDDLFTLYHRGVDSQADITYDLPGTANDRTLALGCASPAQRDDGKLYDSAYDGCEGDAHLANFGDTSVIHLLTQGERLILSVTSGRMTVLGGAYTETWARYPFSPHNVSLSVVAGAGALVYETAAGDAEVDIALGTRLNLVSEGGTVYALVRAGEVRGIGAGADTVACSTNLAARTDAALRVIAACGERVTFTRGGNASLDSRINIPAIDSFAAEGGDGVYTFRFARADGSQLQLLNTRGGAATVSLFSVTEIPPPGQTYIIEAAPADELIADYVRPGQINIAAGVVEAFEFEAPPFTTARFRTELDSALPLITLNARGALGTLTYAAALPADYHLITLGTNLRSRDAAISLSSAQSAEADIAVVITASDSHHDPNISASVSITINLSPEHPGDVQAEFTREGVLIGGNAVFNHNYRGILANITDVRNQGDFSGLAAGSAYTYAVQPALAGVNAIARPGAPQGNAGELRMNAAVTPGPHAVNVIVRDDHTQNTDRQLAVNIEIVTSLSVSPDAEAAEINTTADIAVGTVTAQDGKQPHEYGFRSFTPARAGNIRIADGFDIDSSSGVIRFRGLNLTDNLVVTVSAYAQDAIDDTAAYELMLTIYAPLSALATDRATVYRTYTAADFYTPAAAVSGGKPPYQYDIAAVSSSNPAIVRGSFTINSANGYIRLAAAVTQPAIATLAVQVSDSAAVRAQQSYNLILNITDNDIVTPDHTAVTVRTRDTGRAYTADTRWRDDDYGAITYRLGSITPAADLSIDSASGALSIDTALATEQSVIAALIAETAAVPGVPIVTWQLTLEAVHAVAFDAAAHPRGIRVTTRDTADNLLTVRALHAADEYRYRTNRSDLQMQGNTLNLRRAINSEQTFNLDIIAEDTALFIGDTATLTLAVTVAHPPPLTLAVSRPRFTHQVETPGAVAVLAASGGYHQGGYAFNLSPANNDFAVHHISGSREATLSLTASRAEEVTLNVGVVLSDTHANVAGVSRQFTVEIVSIFAFAEDDIPAAIFRTELDSSRALQTVEVVGALGAVTFLTTSVTPAARAADIALSTLNAADESNRAALFSLQNVVNAAQDISIVLEASDAAPDPQYSSTVTVTLLFSPRHAGLIVADITPEDGRLVADNRIVHNTGYRGDVANIRNVVNDGLSGLNAGSNYTYALDSSAPPQVVIDRNALADGRGSADLRVNAALAAGAYTVIFTIDDDHSQNTPIYSGRITLSVVSPVAAQPSTGSGQQNANNSVVIATVPAAAGQAPYAYSIENVSPAEYESAFSINDATGQLTFNGIRGLTADTGIAVVARITDALGDTADYTYNLQAIVNLAAGSAAVTAHHTYTGDLFDLTAPGVISGGQAPYTYTFAGVQSDDGVTQNSFDDISGTGGALRLAAALPGPADAVVQARVQGNAGGVAVHTLRLAFTDDALVLPAGRTVTIRSTDAGVIATVTAGWNNADAGAISYTLQPSSSGLSISSPGGAVSLQAALGNPVFVTARIIASSDDVLGVADAALALRVTAVTPIYFDLSENVTNLQITTRTQPSALLTARPAGGGGIYAYSTNDSRFNINSSGVLALPAPINAAQNFNLEITARDSALFTNDAATLTVAVNVVAPPAIGVAVEGYQRIHLPGRPGKVAELALSGGSGGYNLQLVPSNSDFAIDYTAGAARATLSLVAAGLQNEDETVAIVRVDDTHNDTAPVNTALTVEVRNRFVAEAVQWFSTLAVSSPRSFATLRLINILGDAQITLQGESIGNITVSSDNIISLTANITSPRTFNNLAMQITDSTNDQHTVHLTMTLAVQDPAAFTPSDRIRINTPSRVTVLEGDYAGAPQILLTVQGLDGYAGPNNRYQDYTYNLISDSAALELDAKDAGGVRLRLSGEVAAGDMLTATVRVTDLTPENQTDAAVTVQVSSVLRIGGQASGRAFAHYWLYPGHADNITASITVSGGVPPYAADITNLSSADRARFNVAVNGNIVEIADNGYIAAQDSHIGSPLDIRLEVTGRQGSASSNELIDLVSTVTLDPESAGARIASGDSGFNVHTVTAAEGAEFYSYEIAAVSPASQSDVYTVLSRPGSNRATVSVSAPAAAGAVTLHIAATDGVSRATAALLVTVFQTVIFIPDHITIFASAFETGTIYHVQAYGGEGDYRYEQISISRTDISITMQTDGAVVFTGDTLERLTLVAEVTDERDDKARQTIVVDFASLEVDNLYVSGSLFIIGGSNNPSDGAAPVAHNDVWALSSPDDTAWEPVIENAAFSARESHAAVAFNGYMWLSGGKTATGEEGLADVWRSSDGRTWTPVTENAAFGKRYDHVMIVHNSEMLVFGGVSEITGSGNSRAITYATGVYSSTDGENWTPILNNLPGNTNYAGMAAAVINNTLVALGGYTGNSGAVSSRRIWRTPQGVWGHDTRAPDAGHSGQMFAHNGILYYYGFLTSQRFGENRVMSHDLYISADGGSSWAETDINPGPENARRSNGFLDTDAGGGLKYGDADGRAVTYGDRIFYLGGSRLNLQYSPDSTRRARDSYYTSTDLRDWGDRFNPPGDLPGTRGRYRMAAVVFSDGNDGVTQPDALIPALRLDVEDGVRTAFKSTVALPYAVASITLSGGADDGVYAVELLGEDADKFSVSLAGSIGTVYMTTAAAGALVVSMQADDGSDNDAYKHPVYINERFVITVIHLINFGADTRATVHISDRTAGPIHTAAARDGAPPYFYRIAAGAPSGLGIDGGSGILEVNTALSAGTAAVTIIASDENFHGIPSNSARQTVTIITRPALRAAAALITVPAGFATITVAAAGGSSAPETQVNIPSLAVISGGSGEYRYALAPAHSAVRITEDGNLHFPAPLGYSRAVTVTARVTDADDEYRDDGYNSSGFEIDVLVTLTTSPPLLLHGGAPTLSVTVVSPNDENGDIIAIAAAGGGAPYNYYFPSNAVNVAAGSDILRDVSLINANAAAGEARVTGYISDSLGNQTRIVYAIDIIAPVALAPVSLTVQAGAADVTLHTLAAAAGSGDYTYALVTAQPPDAVNNFTVSAGGELRLTSALAAGFVSLTVSADDGYTQARAEVVVEAVISVSFASRAVSVYTQRRGVIATVQAQGGLPPYEYEEVGDNPLVSIYAAGAVSLTAALGDARLTLVTIAAQDSFADRAVMTLTLIGAPGVRFAAAGAVAHTIAVDTRGLIYTAQVATMFGSAAYHLTAPNGITANLSLYTDGRLSVITPIGAAAVYPLSIIAQDLAARATLTLNLDVRDNVRFAAAVLTLTAHQSDGAFHTLAAERGNEEYTYRFVRVQPGFYELTVSSSGALSLGADVAVAPAPGIALVAAVTDGLDDSATVTVQVAVTDDVRLPAQRVIIAAAAAGAVVTVQAQGGAAPYTYSAVGAGGGGLAVSDAGVVNLSPALGASAAATLTIAAADRLGGAGGRAQAELIAQTPDPLVLAVTRITAAADLADAAFATVAASGGHLPRYTLIASSPANLAADGRVSMSADGALFDSGAIADTGAGSSYNIDIGVRDAFNAYVRLNAVVVTVVSPLRLASAAVTVLVGETAGGVITVTASGGSGDYRYTLHSVTPAAPGLSHSSGALSLAAALGAAARHTARLQVADGALLTEADIVIAAVNTVSGGFRSADFPLSYAGAVHTLQVQGGAAPYTYAQTGLQPAAAPLALNAQGVVNLSAQQNAYTRFTLLFDVTDGFGKTSPGTLELIAASGASGAALFARGDIYVIGGLDGAVDTDNNTASGDYSSDIWRSDGFASWSAQNAGWAALDSAAAVAYNGYLYVLGGRDSSGNETNSVWRSADGSSWQPMPEPPWAARAGHGAAVLGGTLIIFGGSAAAVTDAWATIDGENWTPRAGSTPAGMVHFNAAVYNDTIYAFGNGSRDYYTSADGGAWNTQANALPHPAADYPAVAVFGGDLFVFGGAGSGNTASRVQRFDGTNWSNYTTTQAGDFSARSGAQALAYRNRLYVIGGSSGSSGSSAVHSNIWHSADGSANSWSTLAVTLGAGRLAHFAAAVFDDDAPLPSQVPPFAAALQDARLTVAAAYAGAVASVSVSGGYVGGGDYDIVLQSDSAALQISDRALQISDSAARAGATVRLTVTLAVNDSHAATPPQLLTHSVAVLPPIQFAGAQYTQPAGNQTGQTLFTAEAGGGSGAFTYALHQPLPLVVRPHLAFNPASGELTVTAALNAPLAATVYIRAVDSRPTPPSTVVAAVNIAVLEGAQINIRRYWRDIRAGDSRAVASVQIISRNDSSAGNIISRSSPAINYHFLSSEIRVTLAPAGGMTIVLEADEVPATGQPARATFIITAYLNNAPAPDGEQIYIIGGGEDGVWKSRTGRTWERAAATVPFGARSGSDMVSWRGSLWIIGGSDSPAPDAAAQNVYADIWRSADGVVWHPVTENAAFPARSHHRLAVFNDALYLFGGFSDAAALLDAGGAHTALGDLWRSDNGADWTEITGTLPEPRYAHAMLTVGSELLIIGGSDNANLRRDVWRSADGENWARTDHAASQYAAALFAPGAAAAAAAGQLYIFSSNGCVYQSADSGVTFTPYIACGGDAGLRQRAYARPLALPGGLYSALGLRMAAGGVRYQNSVERALTDGSGIHDIAADSLARPADRFAYAAAVHNALLPYAPSYEMRLPITPPSAALRSGDTRKVAEADAAAGQPPYSYSLAAGHPAGLQVDDTGDIAVIAGIAAGVYSVTVIAADSVESTEDAAAEFILTVVPGLFFHPSPQTLILDTVSEGVETSLVAAGGHGDYRYTLLSKQPAALALDILTSGGVSVSSPLALQTATLVAAAEADIGGGATVTVELQVVNPVRFDPPADEVSQYGGDAGLVANVAAERGAPPYAYALVSVAAGADFTPEVSAAGEVRLLEEREEYGVAVAYIRAEDALRRRATLRLTVKIDTFYGAQGVETQGDLYVLGGYQTYDDRGGGVPELYRSENFSALTVVIAGVPDERNSYPAGDPRRTLLIAGGIAGAENGNMLSYNGYLYYVGGVIRNNRVAGALRSADGVNWEVATGITPWTSNYSSDRKQPRYGAAAIAFNGQLLFMGGDDGSDKLNDQGEVYYGDVWGSFDGENWRLLNANAFTPKSNMAIAEFNDKLWLIGGSVDESPESDHGLPTNDVLYSDDAISWSTVTVATGLPASFRGDAIAYRGALYYGGAVHEVPISDTNPNLVARAHGRLYRSADGMTWESVFTDDDGNPADVPWPPQIEGKLLVWADKLVMVPGDDRALDPDNDPNDALNQVWSSADGVNWAPEPNMTLIDYVSHDAAVFEGQLTSPAIVAAVESQRQTLVSGVPTEAARLYVYGGNQARGYTLSISGAHADQFTVESGRQVHFAIDLIGELPGGALTLTVHVENIGAPAAQVILGFDDVIDDATGELVDSTGDLVLVGGETAPYDYGNDTAAANAIGYVAAAGDDLGSWSVTDESDSLGLRAGAPMLSFGGDLYVIGGLDPSKPQVMRSRDGENWLPVDGSPGWGALRDHAAFVHDRRLWIIGGVAGGAALNTGLRQEIWSSADGGEWRLENATPGIGARLRPKTAYLNGLHYLVAGQDAAGAGNTGEVYTSANGRDWTAIAGVTGWTAGGIIEPELAVYNGDLYLLALEGGERNLYRSRDGQTWTRLARPADSPLATADSSATRPGEGWRLLARGTDLILISGGGSADLQVWTSNNGVSWTPEESDVFESVTSGKPQNVRNVAAAVLAAGQPPLARAPRLTIQAQREAYYFIYNQAPALIASLTVKGGWESDGYDVQIVSGDAAGRFQLAADGQLRLNTAFPAATAVTLVIEADDDHPDEPPHRLTLAAEFISAELAASEYAQTDGAVYLLPSAGDIVYTRDAGSDWSEAGQLDANDNFNVPEGQLASYNGELLAIGARPAGGGGAPEMRVFYSDNGSDWTSENINIGGARYRHAVIVHNRRLLLLGGAGRARTASADGNAIYGDVWQSVDGRQWQPVNTGNSFTPMAGMAAAVMNGTIFAVGGEGANNALIANQVWTSADGVSWSPLAGVTNLPAGMDGGLAVHAGYLYYTGWGSRATYSSNPDSDSTQVLRSRDGRVWEVATATVPWGARHGARLLQYQNHLLLIGGDGSDSRAVWRSADGVSWQPYGALPAAAAPRSPAAAVFESGEPAAFLQAAISVTLRDVITAVSVGYTGLAASVQASGGYPSGKAVSLTLLATPNSGFAHLSADGGVSITQAIAASMRADGLQLEIEAKDDSSVNEPITLTLTVPVYNPLQFAQTRYTVSVVAGVTRNALATITLAGLGLPPYSNAISLAPSSLTASAPFELAAGANSSRRVINLTGAIALAQTVSALIEISDSVPQTAAYTLHAVVRPSVYFAEDSVTVILHSESDGEVYNTPAADGSGILPLTYERLAVIPNTNANQGDVRIQTSGAIRLANPRAAPQTITVSLGVTDAHSHKADKKIVLRFVEGARVPAADTVTVLITSSGAFYTVSITNPEARYGELDYSYSQADINGGAYTGEQLTRISFNDTGDVAVLALATPLADAGELTIVTRLTDGDDDADVARSALSLHVIVNPLLTLAETAHTLNTHYKFDGALYTLTAALHGLAPYSYALASALHESADPAAVTAAISLSAGSGVITVTRPLPPAMTVITRIRDAAGDSFLHTLALQISASVTFANVTLQVASTRTGVIGTLQAQDGYGAHAFSKVSGSGDIFISGSGQVSLSADVSGGNKQAVVRVTDTALNDTARATIVVRPYDSFAAALEIEVDTPPPGGEHRFARINASGGSGVYNFEINDQFAAAPNGDLFARVYTQNTEAVMTLTVTDADDLAPGVLSFTLSVTTGANVGQAETGHIGNMYILGGGYQGRHQEVFRSKNGSDWTRLVSNDTDIDNLSSNKFTHRRDHAAIAYRGSLYVIAGSTGDSASLRSNGGHGGDDTAIRSVYSSPDGQTWTKLNPSSEASIFSRRDRLDGIVYKDEMLIFGGRTSSSADHGLSEGGNRSAEVWASTDGRNWQKREDLPVGVRYFTPGIINGTLYGIANGHVYYTTDTRQPWTRVLNSELKGDKPPSGLEQQALLVLNNRLLAIGGAIQGSSAGLNSVYISADGKNWQRHALPDGMRLRSSAGAYYNGMLYIYGGVNGNTNFDEVWASPDGTTWTRVHEGTNSSVSGENALPLRSAAKMLVLSPPPDGPSDSSDSSRQQTGGTLYVLGGTNNSASDGAVHYSDDGAAWTSTVYTSADTDYPPPQLSEPLALALNNTLYHIGGRQGSTPVTAVWASANGTISWTNLAQTGDTLPALSNWGGAIFQNSLVIMAGQTAGGSQRVVYTSPNGRAWTKRDDLPDAGISMKPAVLNGTLFVINNARGGSAPTVYYTTDLGSANPWKGINPTGLLNGGYNFLIRGAAALNGRLHVFINGASGAGPYHYASSDGGKSWVDLSQFLPNDFPEDDFAVARFHNAIYIAGDSSLVGATRKVFRYDGASWSQPGLTASAFTRGSMIATEGHSP